jgi:hypothetical protein
MHLLIKLCRESKVTQKRISANREPIRTSNHCRGNKNAELNEGLTNGLGSAGHRGMPFHPER